MLNDSFKRTIKKILIDSNEPLLQKGAEYGWVFPLSLPYPNYKEVLSGETQKIDDYFIEYYSKDFANNLRDHCLKENITSEFIMALIKDVISCFEGGRYYVCLPALFSIIEGLLCDVSNDGKRSKIQYRQGIEYKIRELNAGMEVIPLLSLSYFLHYYFNRSDFDSHEYDEFSLLNRHWSQHGRYITKPDCKKYALQLLSVVALILFILEFDSDS